MSGLIVVKVGGAEGIDLDAFCSDLAALHGRGQRLILVHGGSAETNRVSTQLGVPPRFVTSPSGHTSRFTDRATLEVFEMVYCGKVNKGLVESLQSRGVNALGLSGLDGRLLEGRLKSTVRAVEDGRVLLLRGDHTGTVERVNVSLLGQLLEAGFLPVVTPPAISFEGVAMNVDGDRAAARIAVEMRASQLLLLSNVPGLLTDVSDPASVAAAVRVDGRNMAVGADQTSVSELSVEEAMNVAQGRMRKKVMGAVEAVEGGVTRVIIGSACTEAPITRALAGAGTVIA